MNRNCISRLQLIELIIGIGRRAVFKLNTNQLFPRQNLCDHANITVEDARFFLPFRCCNRQIVIVADLHHLIALPKKLIPEGHCAAPGLIGIDPVADQGVYLDGSCLCFAGGDDDLQPVCHLQAVTPRNAVYRHLQRRFQYALRRFFGNKEEIAAVFKLRAVAGVDGMGGGDNRARLRLAKNLGERHGGHRTAFHQIRQNIPRAHAGELIRIAHHNQAAAQRQSIQKGFKEQAVHHRHFIYNQNITLQRICAVVGKRAGARLNLQQAVQRLRAARADLAHPLGRTSGRGREQNPVAERLKERNHASQRGGFARSGPAGQHHHPVFYRAADRRALRFFIKDAQFLLCFADPAFYLLNFLVPELQKGAQLFSSPGFRLIIIGQINNVQAVDNRRLQLMARTHVFHGDFHFFFRYINIFCAQRQQFFPGQEAMAVLQIMRQNIFHAIADPQLVCRANPVGERQIIGILKGKAINFFPKAVRVFQHYRWRKRAVFPGDFHGKSRRNAQLGQRHQRFPRTERFPKRIGNTPGALFGNAADRR